MADGGIAIASHLDAQGKDLLLYCEYHDYLNHHLILYVVTMAKSSEIGVTMLDKKGCFRISSKDQAHRF